MHATDRPRSVPKIFLSAGEASGEHYGALLIEAIRRINPDTEFFGMGGQRMESLGCRRIVRAEDVAVMGISEVVRHLPRIYGEYRKLKASIQNERPDVAVLIDFPDIHLKLARELRRLGIPVVFFVSPQLWAWKKHRIKQVQRYVDRMLVIFPFEEAFYRERAVDATYVGHPLADLPQPTVSRTDFAAEHSLDPTKAWIGLLPGSRDKELRLNLPDMLQAVAELNREEPDAYEFVLPVAPTLTRAHIARLQAILAAAPDTPRVTMVSDARATLHHARASVVASGTATVEAALIGNPFLVVYRVSALTYAVARRVVSVPFVAMVNLIADRAVVPELIQDDFTAFNVVLHLRRLLHDEEARRTMQSGLMEVGRLLRAGRIDNENAGDTAMDRVAHITMQLAQNPQSELAPTPARSSPAR